MPEVENAAETMLTEEVKPAEQVMSMAEEKPMEPVENQIARAL